MSVSEGRHLDVRLAKGNLVNVQSTAYVLGVFDNINPTGATRSVDRMMGGTLMRLVQDGMLGSRLGEVSILPIAKERLLADMVIFVGLGPIDSFGPGVLEVVAENLARVISVAKLSSCTVVPLGSNAGLKPEESIENFLSGFLRGLATSDPKHQFQMLQFCELDADRFGRLDGHVRQLIERGFFRDKGVDTSIHHTAAEDQPEQAPPQPSEEKQLDPLYLQVRTHKDEAGNSVLDYSVLTADFGPTIQTFTRTITAADSQAAGRALDRATKIDQQLGTELLQYYMPRETQELIARHLEHERDRHVVVIHDKGSSPIPWEVLHFGKCCPAIEAGLSRRFMSSSRMARARSNLPSTTTVRVLLVANPTGDLHSAAEEGVVLERLFKDNKCAVRALAEGQATKANVLKELLTGEYDVLHYAGHAAFVADDPGKSGVICHKREVLAASDVALITNAPQIVFLNGCESARIRGDASDEAPRTVRRVLYEDLPRAVSLAEIIVLGGVSNFIGTYWPVGDAAAGRFATTFYNSLLGGDELGLALRNARRQTREISQRDWANYQHFGNPSYKLRQRLT